jgi:hypothetical protein
MSCSDSDCQIRTLTPNAQAFACARAVTNQFAALTACLQEFSNICSTITCHRHATPSVAMEFKFSLA